MADSHKIKLNRFIKIGDLVDFPQIFRQFAVRHETAFFVSMPEESEKKG